MKTQMTTATLVGLAGLTTSVMGCPSGQMPEGTSSRCISDHIQPNRISNICLNLKGCGEHGKKIGRFFSFTCECEAGYGGACCNDCDVPDIQTVDVDLEEFIRETWYVQKQQVNKVQTKDALYCVAATYDLSGKKATGLNILSKKAIIDVTNFGNRGGVNGEVMAGEEADKLCAYETDMYGKLSVAPCFVPNQLAGPYWIMGVGETDGKYDWAVIIGGQPKEFVAGDPGKCTVKTDNNSGLWLFSRTPNAPLEQIEAMERILVDAGVSTKLLQDVKQENCTYEGAKIKTDAKKSKCMNADGSRKDRCIDIPNHVKEMTKDNAKDKAKIGKCMNADGSRKDRCIEIPDHVKNMNKDKDSSKDNNPENLDSEDDGFSSGFLAKRGKIESSAISTTAMGVAAPALAFAHLLLSHLC